ncbi:MAG: aspartyl/asparaginyl beta-hydroxylase domain-containing protein [Bradyrhizobium sp.]|uniref:aspartyl/asparaginyl beta-hydroxylase domain-containing protein n=1 Tax=Bradyrhizobium sp. TaxID=376 RepID=UPI00122BDBB0|nr:aspartyl/asparaginyl beta-hydroxylase domain-containing protein [Bradyrhizobium sp.]THD73584.1 MAG: aspartyl/asparaginyl beta-hydroxylase domain-containing protein [Bradyrhizobium sp.]
MLMRLFTPQFLIFAWGIGTAIAVHFRGKVRLKYWRQLSDHSTFMAPYNVLMYLFSAVPNQPILRQDAIPELTLLRDNWQVIREEALALFARGQIKAADKYNDAGFNSFFRGGWKRFYLKWYEQPLPSAIANCPKTVELVSAIPSVKGAMFASLPSGGRLFEHRDPYAGSLRYHLGLLVPKSPGECRIFIDGEPYSWREGEDILFDETYVHWAENTTSDNRIILFCDVERPLHTKAMTAVNRWVSRHIINESATQNEEGERVGLVNRIFGYVYHIRLVGKRMKAWNRRVYYAVKYLLLGGIFAAFLATAFL